MLLMALDCGLYLFYTWFTFVFLILSLEGDGFLICDDIYVVTTVIAYDVTYGAGFC
jgi:hypothetical protein